MTLLRKRMIDDMVLAGLAPGTQKQYVIAVSQLAKHYSQSPDKLNEDEIRSYLLYLIKDKRLAKSTMKPKIFGIRFFFDKTLGRKLRTFSIAKARRSKKLPTILSQQEIRRLLHQVRDPLKRMCITMLYACGLRISESIKLEITDIDGDRFLLKIRGKGSKERYVPLPEPTLNQLRAYWCLEKPKPFLFPSPVRSGHIGDSAIRRCVATATKECGIQKAVTPHTLRHSCATHLFEAGHSLRTIQAILGHASPRTTAIYAHVTSKILHGVQRSLNALTKDL